MCLTSTTFCIQMYNTSEEINKRINSGIYQLIPKGPEYTAISRARVDAFNYKKILSILYPETEVAIESARWCLTEKYYKEKYEKYKMRE